MAICDQAGTGETVSIPVTVAKEFMEAHSAGPESIGFEKRREYAVGTMLSALCNAMNKGENDGDSDEGGSSDV